MNKKSLRNRITRYLSSEVDSVLGLYKGGVKPRVILIRNVDAGDLENVEIIDSKQAGEICAKCSKSFDADCTHCDFSAKTLLWKCEAALNGEELGAIV